MVVVVVLLLLVVVVLPVVIDGYIFIVVYGYTNNS